MLTPHDFRQVFESAPGLYLVLDPQLTIIGASNAYLEATMTERERILGKNLFEVFPDNPDEVGATGTTNLRLSLDTVLRERRPDTMAVQKYDIQRPAEEGGGFEVRYWSPRNVPVLGPDRQVQFIIHRVEDVTEFMLLKEERAQVSEMAEGLRSDRDRMQAEILQRSHELQVLNRELEAANRAKTEFLSRMSHEVRTPMTVILGYSELLAMGPLDEQHAQWVEVIGKAGHHLLRLLEDILDIARVETGHSGMTVEPMSAATLVMEAVELARPLAAAGHVSLRSELANASSCYVSADAHRLKQVLLNLLSNAIKYNRPNGTVTLSVRVVGSEKIALDVCDTGEGLQPEALTRLFVPFERLDAAARGIEGTGLGLALSKTLTDAMGGALTAHSVPGEGTTFTVLLPRVVPQAVQPAGPDDQGLVAPRDYDGPRRVLYVEDTLANVELITEIFKFRPGVTVIPAMLGGMALELAREHRPDLVLLDLHLPDLPGDEVLRRLRDDPVTAAIPVVVLSADATRTQELRLLQLGAQLYLTKPISVKRLLDTVDSTLGAPAPMLKSQPAVDRTQARAAPSQAATTE